MKKIVAFLVLAPLLTSAGDLGLPAKKWFLGFGNSPIFTGIRFNFMDRDIEKVNGFSVTMWQPKHSDGDGDVNGISVGLPVAGGTARRNGINLGVAGVSANENLNGINFGALGAGAGKNVNGLNVGGLGLGSGGELNGINLAGLGLGSGEGVHGINIATLGIGTGGDLVGINFAGLGAGAGNDVKGLNVALLGVGAGDDLKGINFGGVGMGAGGDVVGVNIGGVGIGAGGQLTGLNVAGIAVGAPAVNGISIAGVVGGDRIMGISIAPALVKVGDKDQNENSELKGVAIAAVTHIRGENNGVCIGILNMSDGGKGFQLGILNYNSSNPKGLRWLPFFNANFGK